MLENEKDDDWSEIQTSKGKGEETVEFEIESEVEQTNAEQKADTKPEKATTVEKTTQTDPEELDGIQTKGAEKRIRQLIKQRKEREDRISELEVRLQQYEADRQSREEESNRFRISSIEQNEAALKEQIDSAGKTLKKALENGDTDDIVEAQRQLYKAEISLSKLEDQKKVYAKAPAKKTEQTQQQQAPKTVRVADQNIDPSGVDIKAYQWVQKNEEWFNKDIIMTSAALALDAQLRQEGYSPSDDEFYEEVDARMRKAFPQKFKTKAAKVADEDEDDVEVTEQKPPKKASQVVSGASRTSTAPTGKANTVKLTQADIRNAEKWGIPLERYAAQKLATERAGAGEYTTIVTSKRGG